MLLTKEILTSSHLHLQAALAPYVGYGGVGINWRCLGSSGHVDRPAGGVLRNYYKCFSADHENNMYALPAQNQKMQDSQLLSLLDLAGISKALLSRTEPLRHREGIISSTKIHSLPWTPSIIKCAAQACMVMT